MNDDEVQGMRQVARFSAHRPTAIHLPDDPRLATAMVLAHVNGADSIDRAAAIEALTARAEVLADADPQEAIAALAEQLPVLNSLWLKFAAEAITARTPDARAVFLKLALSAQAAYGRTQALVIGLRLQSKGSACVALTNDDGGDS